MRLNARERRTVAALLEDGVSGGKVPVDAEASGRVIEAVLDHASPETRFGWRFLLFALEWASFLLAGAGFGRFSAKPSAARHEILEAMRTSRFYTRRALFKAILAPIYVGHYGRTSAQLALGYDAKAIGSRYQRGDAQ